MAKYSIASGASGAISGAAAGSVFGPVGTGVGAIVGGAAGLFGSKKKKKKRLSTLDPEQQALRQQKIDALYGRGDFANLYNFDTQAAGQNFDQMYGRPSYRNFQENIVPEITGQFRGQGLFNSSYTGQALSRAGRDVQERLDALRGDYLYKGEQQAKQDKMSAIDNLLGMQTFNYGANNPSSLDTILGQVTPAATKYLFNKYGGSSNSNPLAGASGTVTKQIPIGLQS